MREFHTVEQDRVNNVAAACLGVALTVFIVLLTFHGTILWLSIAGSALIAGAWIAWGPRLEHWLEGDLLYERKTRSVASADIRTVQRIEWVWVPSGANRVALVFPGVTLSILIGQTSFALRQEIGVRIRAQFPTRVFDHRAMSALGMAGPADGTADA
ncbi:hypothetical protein [Cellulomonas sp. URHB0016]